MHFVDFRMQLSTLTSDTMDQIVSDFIVSTSSMNLKPNVNKLTCWEWREHDTSIWEGAVAGSVSELYIEPLIPCVGDVDLVSRWKDALVVESVCSEEFSLPSFYANEVFVYRMFNAHRPGYVRLLEVGKLYKKSTNEYLFVASTVNTNYLSFDFQQMLRFSRERKKSMVLQRLSMKM